MLPKPATTEVPAVDKPFLGANKQGGERGGETWIMLPEGDAA